jgi:hypothetical protein
VVELEAFVLKEFVIARVVKNLLTHHNETRVVSTSQTDIVEIIETSAKLRANKGVGWWVKFSSHTVRLEAENTCSDEVDIIAPSGDDGISFNGSAGYTCGSETLLVTLPCFGNGHLFTFANTVADEAVLSSATNNMRLA